MKERAMALREATLEDGTLEECLDEINDFVQTLDRYPPRMIALAMRAHMEILLRALLDCDMCSRQEVRTFARELEQEVLEEDEAEIPREFARERSDTKAGVT
jgi:hypothetical protein